MSSYFFFCIKNKKRFKLSNVGSSTPALRLIQGLNSLQGKKIKNGIKGRF